MSNESIEDIQKCWRRLEKIQNAIINAAKNATEDSFGEVHAAAFLTQYRQTYMEFVNCIALMWPYIKRDIEMMQSRIAYFEANMP